MSWFEEQIKYREQAENADFADAVDSIVNAVMGTRLRNALSKDDLAASAIDEILRFYHINVKEEEIPRQLKTVDEQIEYRMRPLGIKNRKVILEKGWYRQAIGVMLGTLREDGSAVVLLPGKIYGYQLVNIKTGKRQKLNRKTEKLIDDEALCFYEPLPQKELTADDLVKFMFRQTGAFDIFLYVALIVLSTLLGLLSPLFTKWLFGDVLKYNSMRMFVSLAVFALCYLTGRFCFRSFQRAVDARIGVKQNAAVQAAVINRILSLPTSFFKKHSAGELYKRFFCLQEICLILFSSVGALVLTALFSLIYIGQIFLFAPAVGAPALIIIIVSIGYIAVTAFGLTKIKCKEMKLSAEISGLTYVAVTGIQKIKLSGAEKRMFSKWGKCYSEEAQVEYNPPLFFKLRNTISTAIALIGTVIIYVTAVKGKVEVSDYYAFNTAYGLVMSALTTVVAGMPLLTSIYPDFEMLKPILETEPEAYETKENITELRGSIELSHVSFHYDDSIENVIDDLSLKVAPGEYLAVVGPTGCGKSTLMRLLLGFETPQRGSVFFDSKDISKVNLESLRRKIGTVMQDSRLFLGDIYSNIVITAPHLTLDEAWEAAETAAIADDIRAMPMGMHTMISEGQGGVSGGQRQRIIIARAVAPKPKILLFDEATSALDNVTQKKVSDAIDKLDCTRVVIAHRLSTVRHAHRIIYLDGGKIVEEGTYEELIAKNGYFAKLVERQQLDM